MIREHLKHEQVCSYKLSPESEEITFLLLTEECCPSDSDFACLVFFVGFVVFTVHLMVRVMRKKAQSDDLATNRRMVIRLITKLGTLATSAHEANTTQIHGHPI